MAHVVDRVIGSVRLSCATVFVVLLLGLGCRPRLGVRPHERAQAAVQIQSEQPIQAETQDPIEAFPAPLPEMIEHAAGPFIIGSLDGPADERPAKEIVLAAFAIDRTEVSAAAYDACVQKKACTPAGTGENCTAGIPGKERHPINCITWSQADSYCRFADKRLPTEAEWEKAARGGDQKKFVWGDAWPPPANSGNFADRTAVSLKPHWHAIGGYDDGFAATAPVDSMPEARAPQGNLHMAGNVAEWTADWYDAKTYATTIPKGPAKGRARVVRGGSFGSAKALDLRVSRREFYAPEESSVYFGVRCARDAGAGPLPPGSGAVLDAAFFE